MAMSTLGISDDHQMQACLCVYICVCVFVCVCLCICVCVSIAHLFCAFNQFLPLSHPPPPPPPPPPLSFLLIFFVCLLLLMLIRSSKFLPLFYILVTLRSNKNIDEVMMPTFLTMTGDLYDFKLGFLLFFLLFFFFLL